MNPTTQSSSLNSSAQLQGPSSQPASNQQSGLSPLTPGFKAICEYSSDNTNRLKSVWLNSFTRLEACKAVLEAEGKPLLEKIKAIKVSSPEKDQTDLLAKANALFQKLALRNTPPSSTLGQAAEQLQNLYNAAISYETPQFVRYPSQERLKPYLQLVLNANTPPMPIAKNLHVENFPKFTAPASNAAFLLYVIETATQQYEAVQQIKFTSPAVVRIWVRAENELDMVIDAVNNVVWDVMGMWYPKRDNQDQRKAILTCIEEGPAQVTDLPTAIFGTEGGVGLIPFKLASLKLPTPASSYNLRQDSLGGRQHPLNASVLSFKDSDSNSDADSNDSLDLNQSSFR